MIALLLISSKQGHRVNDLRESESFYRWIIAASALTRMGDPLEPDAGVAEESMDDELFAELEPLAETILIDYEVDPKYDEKDGKINSRLLRAVRIMDDEAIWALACSPELAALKNDFLKYRSAQLIQSAGITFGITDIYDGSDTSKVSTSVPGVGLTSMFFGMRTLSANLLWLKVDTFWHTGELHRMIPMMHTCVTLDPQFVDAFLLGAWHLSYNVTAQMVDTPEINKVFSEKYQRRLGDKELFYYSAAEFLKDGIRKNPRDYRLYFDLGYAVYEQKLHDHVNAIRYLDEAIRHRHDIWVPRMLYRSLMLNTQFEDAIEGWEEYLTKFPGHIVATRFLKINNAHLHDAITDEARECKKLALEAQKKILLDAEAVRNNDPTKAASLEAEALKAADFAIEMESLATKENDAAMLIWNELYQDSSDDVIAYGRIARNRAMKLWDDGRYMEAIAELDILRWQALHYFEEASDLIIEIKAEADIPYTLSEQMELLRRDDIKKAGLEDERMSDPISRIECIYRTM